MELKLPKSIEKLIHPRLRSGELTKSVDISVEDVTKLLTNLDSSIKVVLKCKASEEYTNNLGRISPKTITDLISEQLEPRYNLAIDGKHEVYTREGIETHYIDLKKRYIPVEGGFEEIRVMYDLLNRIGISYIIKKEG
jgi:hypothetical protein|tara:strand:- start:4343 stop:4756 length:414 start_codon:yes stop_codon:yes gene_type:complete